MTFATGGKSADRDFTKDIPIRIFVHLARDKDVVNWQEQRRAGTLVGVNDETPYGYGRAERMGCEVSFSRSCKENFAVKFFRLVIRVLTGFDFLHVRRQGKLIKKADVVWTHTESQFLAVAALTYWWNKPPKIIGQSVWLFDHWYELSAVKRWFYRKLISKVDLLTVHSECNLAVLQKIFPQKKSALVLFGIPTESMRAPIRRSIVPINILSIGSDRDRDWHTLIEVVRNQSDMTLTILSGTANPKLVNSVSNANILRARSNKDLNEHFDNATVVCVPLIPNKHASGITVIQEAILAGVPVIATDTGGLFSYFSADQIRYVSPRDVNELRYAIRDTVHNSDRSLVQAEMAQRRLSEPGMGAEAFVRRHVELSRELLDQRSVLQASIDDPP